MRTCRECGKPIDTTDHRAKYCLPKWQGQKSECFEKWDKRRKRESYLRGVGEEKPNRPGKPKGGRGYKPKGLPSRLCLAPGCPRNNRPFRPACEWERGCTYGCHKKMIAEEAA